MTDQLFIKKYLDDFADKLNEQHEIRVQQVSASNSELLKEITSMKIKVESMQLMQNSMQKTIDGWKTGTKYSFWAFVGLGGIITWVLNSSGLHISVLK